MSNPDAQLKRAITSIRNLVEQHMLHDPLTKSRTRTAISAKAVYYILLKDLGFSLSELEGLIGVDRASMMHHVNSDYKRDLLGNDIQALMPRAKKVLSLYRSGEK